MSGAVQPEIRVRKLFETAKSLGLQGPTETMVCECIKDAEWSALYKPKEVAELHKIKPSFIKEVWRQAQEILNENTKTF